MPKMAFKTVIQQGAFPRPMPEREPQRLGGFWVESLCVSMMLINISLLARPSAKADGEKCSREQKQGITTKSAT